MREARSEAEAHVRLDLCGLGLVMLVIMLVQGVCVETCQRRSCVTVARSEWRANAASYRRSVNQSRSQTSVLKLCSLSANKFAVLDERLVAHGSLV